MFQRIYLHIPYCLQKCPYCAFTSSPETDPEVIARYGALLLDEIYLAAQSTAPGGPLDSVYFGGGTPSLMPPDMVAGIITGLAHVFPLADKVEITLEANPGTVTRRILEQFRAAGVNRLSLGIQSFDDRQLRTLGRIHSSREAVSALEAARDAGFDNLGIDLMHALPGQTLEMWEDTLARAVQLAPEHLSVYGLSVEEGTPFAERYCHDSPDLPDDDLSARMYERTEELLSTSGYEHYEIANYARPGRRSRHNCGYWRGDGYLGLGCGAHSYLLHGDYGIRFGNEPDCSEYARAIMAGRLVRCNEQRLTRQEALAEFMFLGLRMLDGVDFSTFRDSFGVNMDDVFGKELEELSVLGLLNRDPAGIRLTRQGLLLSNQVFVKFLL